MKLKLIISLLSIVGMSACSTSTIVENRSCDRNEDFPWHKTWNQNCSSADNSNGNSSEYSSLRETISSANDISGSESRDDVTADLRAGDENVSPTPNAENNPPDTSSPTPEVDSKENSPTEVDDKENSPTEVDDKEDNRNPEPNKPESDNDENIEGDGLDQDL